MFNIDGLIALIEEGVVEVEDHSCFYSYYKFISGGPSLHMYLNKPWLLFPVYYLEDRGVERRVLWLRQRDLWRLAKVTKAALKRTTAPKANDQIQQLLETRNRATLEALFKRSGKA